jgi:diaminohydroxyphosphoribosylaminopyrimidine deaminase/5-amino-6-(5-phosphoribosylamino)uracil reductase
MKSSRGAAVERSPHGLSQPLPSARKAGSDPMQLALAMGRRRLGQTRPNPAVGAVVIDPASNQIYGAGGTGIGGRPHAEVVALEMAGARAAGATLVVTLEPCCHHGRSPPCVDAIIAAGITRVIYGVPDPNPLVAGQGLAALRAHGIEIAQDPACAAAHWLSLGHILRMRANRPLVTLKLALGADGLIPRGTGQPHFVTGPLARARAHLMRAQADAILVGHGTIKADNPDLTCRLPGMAARSPVRVVLARFADLSPLSSVVRTAGTVPTMVLHGLDAPPANIARLRSLGVTCQSCAPRADGQLDVSSVLQVLSENGITRVLVEGGPTLAASFLQRGFVDELAIMRGAVDAGSNAIAPPQVLHTGREGQPPPGFCHHASARLGEDQLDIFHSEAQSHHVYRSHQ